MRSSQVWGEKGVAVGQPFLQPSGLCSRMARKNSLLSKTYMTAHLEVDKRPLKDSQIIRNKTNQFWDEAVTVQTVEQVKHGEYFLKTL